MTKQPDFLDKLARLTKLSINFLKVITKTILILMIIISLDHTFKRVTWPESLKGEVKRPKILFSSKVTLDSLTFELLKRGELVQCLLAFLNSDVLMMLMIISLISKN